MVLDIPEQSFAKNNMQIISNLTNRLGQVLDVVYNDVDSVEELGEIKIDAVHGFCFCGEKLVLVYSDEKGYWAPPGGGTEEGEDVPTALAREIKEETNMKILEQRIIGYQVISEPRGQIAQTRSVCLVEPYGPFESDPDGDVTKIALIDPNDIKQYFDWGKVGDHIFDRALELKKEMGN